ncbi:MAG: YtxH domain-containing protein [Bacteroidia bacterium]
MNNSAKVVLGVLAGLTAGAALGVLFAPEKGTDTRKKIAKKGNDYVDELKDKLDELTGMINDKFESLQSKGDHFAEKGKAKLNHNHVKHDHM